MDLMQQQIDALQAEMADRLQMIHANKGLYAEADALASAFTGLGLTSHAGAYESRRAVSTWVVIDLFATAEQVTQAIADAGLRVDFVRTLEDGDSAGYIHLLGLKTYLLASPAAVAALALAEVGVGHA